MKEEVISQVQSGTKRTETNLKRMDSMDRREGVQSKPKKGDSAACEKAADQRASILPNRDLYSSREMRSRIRRYRY